MTHRSDLRRLGLFDAKVPRFTSFPPATWFSADVGGAEATAWRKALPEGAALSLYVHVPFCRRLCWFCACRTQGTKSDGPLMPYVEDLLTEARQVRAELPQAVRVARLHLGGGTPTMLPPAALEALMSGLEAIFGLADADEVSVEIDPLEFDAARLRVLVAHGLNRASLGVQDFDPQVQAAIGREQSLEETRVAADLLHGVGITDINIDLLYGLPHQTETSLRRTLDAVLELQPTRLALYGYAHVPWMSKRQVMIPADALPGPEARFELFELARRKLRGEGFAQIGIDHFARPGDGLADALAERRLARSFQGYTDDRVGCLVGMGASAISRYPQGYVQNLPGTAAWSAAVRAGAAPAARGFALERDHELRAELIEQLMCYHGVRLAEVTGDRRRAADLLSDLAGAYPEAIRFDGETLSLAPWSLPLLRIMATRIAGEKAADPGKPTYSAAV